MADPRAKKAKGFGPEHAAGALRAARGLAFIAPLLLAWAAPGSAPAAEEKTSSVAGEKAGKKSSAAKPKGKKGDKKGKEAGKVIVWLRIGKVVPGGVQVKVQPFQRLQDIANAYGISTQDILKANDNISANVIKSGQELLIPGATSVKAVKTFVPADKIDQLEGIGIQINPPGASGGGKAPKKKAKKKKKESGKVPIKSGSVTSKGVVHTIQQGQTLHIIAQAYGISKSKITKANGLKNENIIQPGQKVLIPGAKKVVAVEGYEGGNESEGNTIKSGKLVKAGVLHTVMPGQTLWIISKAYKVKIDSILKANGLKNQNSIKVGSKLLIPEAKKVVAVSYSSKANALYLHPITFHRIHSGETQSLNLFTMTGKINKSQGKIFEKMMYDHRKNKTHKIHPRLIYLIAKVAQHFSYKTIIIYSGFRAYSKEQYTKKSKHNVGRAIDFAVEGVSNWKLMSYCRTFGNVGVGYYPNSYFVHLDVREEPAFWIDYSGPGQKPKYGKKKAGLKKKAKKGAIPPKSGVDEEAESDALDVEIPK